MSIRHILLLFGIFCTHIGYGQDSMSKADILQHFSRYYGKGITEKLDSVLSLPGSAIEKLNPRVYKRNDTLWIYSGICKPLKISRHFVGAGKIINANAQRKETPFLSVKGNIQYDFLYRSFIDTPYSQNDFQQHTIQTALSIVVKDRYPLKLNLSTRLSNSPFFRNFMDVNMQFDKYAYVKNKKQKMLDKLAVNHFQQPDLKIMEAALQEMVEKYNSLKQRLIEPDIFQAIIEEREKEYYGTSELAVNPSALQAVQGIDIKGLNQRLTYKKERPFPKLDSSGAGNEKKYNDFIGDKKKELDSLEKSVTKLQKKADSLRNAITKSLASVRQKVNRASSQRELQKIASENGLEPEKKDGSETFLSDVKSIGIGRSVINYSELTAWNVSLTGAHIEYNPGIYAALAIGKIDYGFRDFFGKNIRRKGQNLLMARIGIGDKDQKAIILSAFTGRKYSYGSVLSDTVSSHINVAGYSLEAILKKNENTGLGVEIAKTTKPVSNSFQKNDGLNSLLNFSDKSNLGVSIKAQTIIKETDTRLNGFYRKTGENFQSFSLFTYNTDQTAWLLKVDQSFLKNKIGLIAMLRRNDFTNPFTEKTFKTSTVFKSFQLNVRMPKWPMLSAGYYPGTQLYIIDKERIRENAYYIMNASVIHHYSVGGIRMLSSVIYNRYSSKGTDSGFISYKGISYMASHSLIFQKAQLQGSYIFTDQEQMQFCTWEGNADYSLTKSIRVGAGAKYNKVIDGKSYWGSRAQLAVEIGKIGGLQLQYEKSYLPTIYKTLFPIETGRVSWFKYF
jgi:hypothetical protein